MKVTNKDNTSSGKKDGKNDAKKLIDDLFKKKQISKQEEVKAPANDDQSSVVDKKIKDEKKKLKLKKKLKEQRKEEEKQNKKQEKKAKKYTEDGLKIYSMDELGIGKGGNTDDCPFDCNCCF